MSTGSASGNGPPVEVAEREDDRLEQLQAGVGEMQIAPGVAFGPIRIVDAPDMAAGSPPGSCTVESATYTRVLGVLNISRSMTPQISDAAVALGSFGVRFMMARIDTV